MKYLLLSTAVLLSGCMATVDPAGAISYPERAVYVAKAYKPIRAAHRIVYRGYNYRYRAPYWTPYYNCQLGTACSHTNYRRKIRRPFYISYRKAPVIIGKRFKRHGPAIKKVPKAKRTNPNSRKNHKKKNKHKRYKRR
jgi:hypothetical protein